MMTSVLSLALVGCSKMQTTSEQIASDTANFGACASYREKVVTTLSEALIQKQELPSGAELEKALRKKLVTLKASKREALIRNVMQTYKTLTVDTQASLGLKTKSEMLEALTALEIGDTTTEQKKLLGQQIQRSFASVNTSASSAGMDCDDEAAPPAIVDGGGATFNKVDPMISGALRVMTTAYQGCQGLDLPAMTSSTPDAQGVSVTGEHPSGGLNRAISNLANLKRTHYYIKEGIQSASGCFDVPNNPLIYDFGGKPYATTAETSPIDLFKDAGTGTKVLGIDCSAYVVSAMAVSGLRLTPNKKMKASLVYGVSSTMLMNPASNGLGCLAPVTFTPGSTMKSGDVVAVSGHVVMVDLTGPDPFGLARAKNVGECTTSVLHPRGFDFDILQSSPIKGAVGLDRIRASAYLDTTGKMGLTFLGYAVSACKVKFGQAPGSAPSSGRIVRHKMTPECLDKPVPLARESCVQSCYARAGLN